MGACGQCHLHESKVTAIASGSGFELAIETQKILKDNKVDSR